MRLFLGMAPGKGLTTALSTYTPSDSDALSIVTAIETADGQTLESTVKLAINTFVVGCKSDSIWTALNSGVFRFLAGPRTIAGVLKAGVGTDPTNVNFVSGDLTRATGLKGNGSSKYLNTNRAASADGQNSHHFSVYARRETNNATEIVMNGRTSGNDVGSKLIAYLSTGNDVAYASVPNLDNSSQIGPDVLINASTLMAVNRQVSTEYLIRSSGTTSTATQTSGTPSTQTIFVFARNNGGSPSLYSTARVGFYSVGDNLGGSTQLTALDTRVSQYMTDIAGI
jgi:hypothetical protein